VREALYFSLCAQLRFLHKPLWEAMVKKAQTKTGMVTNRQVKAARAWLNLSQDDLAEKSAVTRRSIQDFESGKRVPQARTLRDLQKALEDEGIEFIFSGERGIGIRERHPE
jgi:DNA-binding XRE family transcriptional regulator